MYHVELILVGITFFMAIIALFKSSGAEITADIAQKNYLKTRKEILDIKWDLSLAIDKCIEKRVMERLIKLEEKFEKAHCDHRCKIHCNKKQRKKGI